MSEQPRDRLVRLATEVMHEKLRNPKNLTKGADWEELGCGALVLLAVLAMSELGSEFVAQWKGTAPERKTQYREEIGNCMAYLAMLLDKVEVVE